jgi:hypothetical protein
VKARDRFGRRFDRRDAIAALRQLAAEDPSLRAEAHARMRRHALAIVRAQPVRQRGRCAGPRPGRRTRRTTRASSSSDDGPGDSEPPESGRR